LKYGLFGINNGICADPEVMRAVATAAENCGFESLWTGEHVVLPDPQEPPSPAAPLFSMVHPSTALSYIAGFTSRIKLGTGVTLLAQRNAVVLAKEMGNLDHLSAGRLLFGIGAGYLKAEFDALGVNFEERGASTSQPCANSGLQMHLHLMGGFFPSRASRRVRNLLKQVVPPSSSVAIHLPHFAAQLPAHRVGMGSAWIKMAPDNVLKA